MKAQEIVARRLANQHLVGTLLKDPVAVVGHFAAMQAQDYYGAKWAVGQRCGANDDEVDEAFNDGRILRTHLCRPTWHFVTAEDIRWMLAITGPRVHQANAFMNRSRGLDTKLLNRGTDIMAKALAGGKHLEREELMSLLNRARIDTSEFRSAHFMMYAELEGVVCSGPRKGKQFTYALLEERVPRAKELSRDEALAEITRRYFNSRGPATLHDLALWSGLTIADAKRGITMVGRDFVRVGIGGKDNWFTQTGELRKIPANTAHLVPNYDEYGIGYKDRSAFYDPVQARDGRNNPVFRHLVLLNGRMIGTWDRTLVKRSVSIVDSLFVPPAAAASRALQKGKARYARFLGLSLAV